MQLPKDVAQQARFAAMQPGQINRHLLEQDADLRAFHQAARAAHYARHYRELKAQVLDGTSTIAGMKPSQYEVLARKFEKQVREIALQSEIRLQRRADAERFDRALIGTMLGAAS